MLWQKPNKDTEATQTWANMTLGDPNGGGGGPYGPGSYELLNVILFSPFWLTYKLLSIPVKLCLFLIRRVRHHQAASATRR